KWPASPNGLPLDLIVNWSSRPDGHRSRDFRRRRRSPFIGGAAGLAHAGTGFQERDFTGGQAAVMDELLAQTATGPPAGKKRFVTVEGFVADLAIPGFNPQQHGLPRSAAFSDTHTLEYSEAIRWKTRRRRGVSRCPFTVRIDRAQFNVLPPSLLVSSIWEWHPCWSHCGRRTSTF